MKIERIELLGPTFRFVARPDQAAEAKDGWIQGLSVTYLDETGFKSQCHIQFECEKNGEFKRELFCTALKTLANFFERNPNL